jgi:K+-sensing histidine kinase KdpD
VLGSAVLWGLGVAVATAIASMIVFNFLFLPPVSAAPYRDIERHVILSSVPYQLFR